MCGKFLFCRIGFAAVREPTSPSIEEDGSTRWGLNSQPLSIPNLSSPNLPMRIGALPQFRFAPGAAFVPLQVFTYLGSGRFQRSTTPSQVIKPSSLICHASCSLISSSQPSGGHLVPGSTDPHLAESRHPSPSNLSSDESTIAAHRRSDCDGILNRCNQIDAALQSSENY